MPLYSLVILYIYKSIKKPNIVLDYTAVVHVYTFLVLIISLQSKYSFKIVSFFFFNKLNVLMVHTIYIPIELKEKINK